MKILKNASLCILLPLMLSVGFPATYTADIILTDEFEIVATSSGGPHRTVENVCSPSIQILKSITARMPEFITVSAVANSIMHTTSQKVTVDIFSTNNLTTSIGYAEFPDLLSGHRGMCTVDYTMEVYTEDGVIVKTLTTSEMAPRRCY